MGLEEEILQLLYQALAAKYGIIVSFTGSFETLRMKAYQARKKAADPALEVLQFRLSPEGKKDQMWIVKTRSIVPGEEKPEEVELEGLIKSLDINV